MKCAEFEQIKDSYVQGHLSGEEEQALEAHLENCPDCQKVLDRLLQEDEGEGEGEEQVGQTGQVGHVGQQNISKKDEKDKIGKISKIGKIEGKEDLSIDEQKQQKILRRAKYKNRLSMTIFLLALLLAGHLAGGFLSSYYLNWGGEESRIFKAQRTAALLTELTFPNVTMPSPVYPFPTFLSRGVWGHSSLEIKPYFVATGSYALKKQVGKEKTIIGQLKLNHFFNSISKQWEWKGDSHEQYLYFYHPEQLHHPQHIYGLEENQPGREYEFLPHMAASAAETWQTLDILPAGTVGELALSFWQTYSTGEVMTMLKDYDLEITWYAVSTGLEGEEARKGGEKHQRPITAFDGAWGFSGTSSRMLSTNNSFHLEVSSVRENHFMQSMEYLLENEKLARKLFRGNVQNMRLAERYNYLQENGIQVYGVVVTGPSKELLKLQELDAIHTPALGEIQLWNWFERGFRGTFY